MSTIEQRSPSSPSGGAPERSLERVLFASRWLMAPFYLGLVVALVVLLLKFLEHIWHFATHAWSASENEVIIGLLSLIDLSLTGNLLLMVIFSGYENFVSKIDVGRERLGWMGKVDFSGLKLKLLGSIVAISAIQLLRAFMDVSQMSDRDLMWLAIVHGVFVVSGVFLAVSDLIAERSHQVKGTPAHHAADDREGHGL